MTRAGNKAGYPPVRPDQQRIIEVNDQYICFFDRERQLWIPAVMSSSKRDGQHNECVLFIRYDRHRNMSAPIGKHFRKDAVSFLLLRGRQSKGARVHSYAALPYQLPGDLVYALAEARRQRIEEGGGLYRY